MTARWTTYLALLTVTLLSTVIADDTRAQALLQTSPRHAAYVELGGSTTVYSLNYEYRPSAAAAFRLGIMTTPSGYRDATMHGLVLGGSYLIGPSRHRLELGVTTTAAYVRDNPIAYDARVPKPGPGLGLSVSPIIGYRFDPRGTGFMLRLGLTPVIPVAGPSLSQSPWKGGLSVGWRF